MTAPDVPCFVRGCIRTQESILFNCYALYSRSFMVYIRSCHSSAVKASCLCFVCDVRSGACSRWFFCFRVSPAVHHSTIALYTFVSASWSVLVCVHSKILKFMDYLTTLSVSQAVKCSVVGQLENEELEMCGRKLS